MKKRSSKWIAIAVAVMMLLMTPAQSLAAAGGKYVSDVYVMYAKKADDAERALKNKGYTPVKGNLNVAARNSAVLGYKTTDDKRKALTNISLMNSMGGYSVGDYENLIKMRKKDIAAFLKSFMNAVKEFRYNYDVKKSKRAILAYELLNKYYDPDSGKKMGDLLLGDTLQDKVGIDESIDYDNKEKAPDLVTIIMQANTIALSSIYEILGMAVDTNDKSWMQRYSDMDYDDLYADAQKKYPDLVGGYLQEKVRGMYHGDAVLLYAGAQILGPKFKQYEKSKLKLEKADAKALDKKYGEPGTKNLDQLDNLNEIKNYIEVGTLYENIKNHEGKKLKKGEMLELFVNEYGDGSIGKPPEFYYVMAATLSKGQKALLPLVPLEDLLSYGFMDEQGWTKEFDDKKAKFSNIEKANIYEGVDRDVYLTDGTVALTDEAKRKKAGVLESSLDNKGIRHILAVAATISWGITGATFAYAKFAQSRFNKATNYWVKTLGDTTFNDLYTELGNAKKVAEHVTDSKNGYVAMTAGGDLIEDGRFTTAALDEEAAMFGSHYDFYKPMQSVLKYATIALAIIAAGVTIAALVTDEKVDLPPVPKYIVDVSEKDDKNLQITYKAANSNGPEYFKKKTEDEYEKTYADTKAYEGKQWLVVYTSRDENAGKPVVADIVVKNDPNMPSGYTEALNVIGQKGATNLVSKQYMNLSRANEIVTRNNKVYVFYKEQNDDGIASLFTNGSMMIIFFGILIVLVALVLVVRRSRMNQSGGKN